MGLFPSIDMLLADALHGVFQRENENSTSAETKKLNSKAQVKSRKWIEKECISTLKKKIQIDKELTKAYHEHRIVNGLGDISRYDAVDIFTEEAGAMDKVSQTAMKVCRDIETVRKNRNSDFHSRRDTFSREWKQMEDIMRQEGVESIEISHKD